MPIINQLSQVSSVRSSDIVPIYSSNNTHAMGASVSTVASFISANVTKSEDGGYLIILPNIVTVVVDFNVTPAAQFIYLVGKNNVSTFTLTLPPVVSCIDRQQITLFAMVGIAALSIMPNGATVLGGLSTMVAATAITLRYDKLTKTWYRVG